MKQHRLSLCLSATALLVAVFGSTPLGQAATRAARAVIPPHAKTAGYAKTAGFAKIAGNAALLNGRKSSSRGTPGTVLVVGASGKLPAALGAVGPQGPTGAAGQAGLAGYELVQKEGTFTTVGALGEVDELACPGGKLAVGGGGIAELVRNGALQAPADVFSSQPTSNGAGWSIVVGKQDGTRLAADETITYAITVICVKKPPVS